MLKKERDKLRKEIRSQILTSKESIDILGITRARLNQLVKTDRLESIKSGIYLKEDILAIKRGQENKKDYFDKIEIN